MSLAVAITPSCLSRSGFGLGSCERERVVGVHGCTTELGAIGLHWAAVTIGQEIKTARQRARLSQKTLAARLGVGTNTVSNWETGATEPTKHLGALREILDMDPTSPVTDIRELADDELFRRAREVDWEIERRFYTRTPGDRTPGGTGRMPPHLRRQDPEDGLDHTDAPHEA